MSLKSLFEKKFTMKYHYTPLTGKLYEGTSWGLAMLCNLTSVAVTQMYTHVKTSWAIHLGSMHLTWLQFNKPELEKVWPREWPRGFSGGSDGKESACSAGDLGREDPLGKGLTTHSSILARRILWTWEPERLQSTGSPRVRHDWVTNTHTDGYTSVISLVLVLGLQYSCLENPMDKGAWWDYSS